MRSIAVPQRLDNFVSNPRVRHNRVILAAKSLDQHTNVGEERNGGLIFDVFCPRSDFATSIRLGTPAHAAASRARHDDLSHTCTPRSPASSAASRFSRPTRRSSAASRQQKPLVQHRDPRSLVHAPLHRLQPRDLPRDLPAAPCADHRRRNRSIATSEPHRKRAKLPQSARLRGTEPFRHRWLITDAYYSLELL